MKGLLGGAEGPDLSLLIFNESIKLGCRADCITHCQSCRNLSKHMKEILQASVTICKSGSEKVCVDRTLAKTKRGK